MLYYLDHVVVGVSVHLPLKHPLGVHELAVPVTKVTVTVHNAHHHYHHHQIIITASPLALTSHHATQHHQHHALLVNMLVLRPLLEGRLQRVSHVLWRNKI